MYRAYLAITDEEITRKQKQVKDANDKLIEEYHKLSFWDRHFSGRGMGIHQLVTMNWLNFNNWMNAKTCFII